jgi:hypothetical protein
MYVVSHPDAVPYDDLLGENESRHDALDEKVSERAGRKRQPLYGSKTDVVHPTTS